MAKPMNASNAHSHVVTGKTYVWPDGRRHTVPYKQYQRQHPNHVLRPPVHPAPNKRPAAKPPLTAAQKRAKALNAFYRNLADVGHSLSGKDLIGAAQRITDSAYNPLLKDNQQQSQAATLSGGIQQQYAKSHYAGLDSLLSGIGGAQDTANTAAVTDAQQRAAATQKAITDAATAARARMGADAAVRGAGLDGGANATLAAQTAGQQGLAAQEGARNVQATQDFGGAQAAFLKGLRGATAQAGGELQGQIQGNTAQLVNQLAADRSKLQANRTGDYTKNLLDMRQQEAENLFTRAGLGIDQAKINATMATASASQRNAKAKLKLEQQKAKFDQAYKNAQIDIKRGIDPVTGKRLKGKKSANDALTQWKLKYAQQHGYLPPTGKPKAGGSTASALKTQGDAQDNLGAAIQDAKFLQQHGWSRQRIMDTLIHGRKEQSVTQTVRNKDGSQSRKVVTARGLDPHGALWASVATDVVLDGFISQYNIRRLHARGVDVSALGYRTKPKPHRNANRGSSPAVSGGSLGGSMPH